MTQDKDPIQKAIDAEKLIANASTKRDEICHFYHMHQDTIREALSALRGMKAVDVGALKRSMDEYKDEDGDIDDVWEYDAGCAWDKGYNACLDHLTSNGYVIMKAGV